MSSGVIDPGNHEMTQNVLRAAAELGVKRVVLASSIHADMPVREPGGLRSPYRLPEPDSPYGASKVAGEALGRYYAAHRRLEVICVRFGWVSPNPTERPSPHRPWAAGEAWLSHRDCVSLIAACLGVPSLPGRYAIVHGVSDRRGGVHDLANPLSWQPHDRYRTAGPIAGALGGPARRLRDAAARRPAPADRRSARSPRAPPRGERPRQPGGQPRLTAGVGQQQVPAGPVARPRIQPAELGRRRQRQPRPRAQLRPRAPEAGDHLEPSRPTPTRTTATPPRSSAGRSPRTWPAPRPAHSTRSTR
jgi:hypothetical protein